MCVKIDDGASRASEATLARVLTLLPPGTWSADELAALETFAEVELFNWVGCVGRGAVSCAPNVVAASSINVGRLTTKNWPPSSIATPPAATQQ